MGITRDSRVRRFWRECGIGENTSIIDIGGTMYFWNLARSLGLTVPRRIVIVNLKFGDPRVHPTGALLVHGDACDLHNFEPGQFDVAFSNSVIEHLSTWQAQQRMAQELHRVAKIYWIQTPDPRFPIEPHYLAPAIHWLPKRWRRRVAPWTLWGVLKHPTDAEIAARIAELRLLTRREMQELFPDARLIVERFGGWPKSLIATNAVPSDRSTSDQSNGC
jgi:hypothetical protein